MKIVQFVNIVQMSILSSITLVDPSELKSELNALMLYGLGEKKREMLF